MESKIDIGSLYTVRMFIYLETEPQSNQYERVMLNQEQYKRVSGAVYDCFPKDPSHECDNPNCKGVALLTSDSPIPLPDVSDIHSCVGECTC